LKADDALRDIDGEMKRFARRKRLKIARFLLYRPHSLNRRVNPLRSDHLKHCDNSGGVRHCGPLDL
jgi:hypothetical protein